MTLVFNKVIAPVLGAELDARAASEGLAILEQSLHVIETVWLQDGYPFLASGRQPSIADLSLVCEIMQLQVCLSPFHFKCSFLCAWLLHSHSLLQLLGEDEVTAILSSKKRVAAWIAAVKKATSPHFDEVHKMLYKSAARRAQDRRAGTASDYSKPPISKL